MFKYKILYLTMLIVLFEQHLIFSICKWSIILYGWHYWVQPVFSEGCCPYPTPQLSIYLILYKISPLEKSF